MKKLGRPLLDTYIAAGLVLPVQIVSLDQSCYKGGDSENPEYSRMGDFYLEPIQQTFSAFLSNFNSVR